MQDRVLAELHEPGVLCRAPFPSLVALQPVKLERIFPLQAFPGAGCSPVLNPGGIFSCLCSAWNKHFMQLQASGRGELCRHAPLRVLQWLEWLLWEQTWLFQVQ